MINYILEQTLHLAARGWHVLPVHGVHSDGTCTCGKGDHGKDVGKHPRVTGWQGEATLDPARITEWLVRWPDMNVAVVTGSTSGLLILDVDGEAGASSLAALEAENGCLPFTPTVRTGSGGRQHYFGWTSECDGLTTGTGIRPGLDYRGHGGLAVAPPSLHRTGNRYQWIVGPETPLAPAPTWLAQILRDAKPRAKPAAILPSGEMIFTVENEGGDLFGDGVKEPGRNNELCRRLGKHIKRGDSRATLDALALAWGERCDPPLDAEEVNGVVASIWNKEESKRGERSEESEETSSFASFASVAMPPVIAESSPGSLFASFASFAGSGYPVLHPDAYHGLAGDIIRAVDPQTEADPVGVLFSLLTAFGSAVGRGAYYPVGSGVHRANLFALLCGDTASGKGMAWDSAHDLVRCANPDWDRGCVAYGLSSGEGLIERVGDDPAPAPQPGETGIASFVVQGDKCLLCLETEFAKLITSMRREGNVLSALLRSAWDGKPLECLTRAKQKLRASAAHISVIGHITYDEYAKILERGTEVANGFSNRFLHVLVHSEKSLPHGGNRAVLDPFIEPVAKAIQRAKLIRAVTRTAEADALWETAYPRLRQSKPGAYGRAVERARPQALRLALVYALMDGTDRLGLAHMRAGLAAWEYCERSAQLIFERGIGVQPPAPQPTPQEALPEKLLRIIGSSPGLSQTHLHDALARHVGADALNAALTTLSTAGKVVARQQSKGTGRPAICWWTCEESELTLSPSFAVANESLTRDELSEETPSDTLGGVTSHCELSERTPSADQISSSLNSQCEESVAATQDVSSPEAVSSPSTPNLVAFAEMPIRGNALVGLPELLVWIGANGRRLVVRADGGVGCVPDPIPDQIRAALDHCQHDLRGFAVVTRPASLVVEEDEGITPEYIAELRGCGSQEQKS